LAKKAAGTSYQTVLAEKSLGLYNVTETVSN